MILRTSNDCHSFFLEDIKGSACAKAFRIDGKNGRSVGKEQEENETVFGPLIFATTPNSGTERQWARTENRLIVENWQACNSFVSFVSFSYARVIQLSAGLMEGMSGETTIEMVRVSPSLRNSPHQGERGVVRWNTRRAFMHRGPPVSVPYPSAGTRRCALL